MDAKQQSFNRFVKWIDKKEISAFPPAVINNLRPYHYGGMPLSIMLPVAEFNNGLCYDRAMLLSLAFEKCTYHVADIESLQLNHGKDLAGHAFIESDGLVFDTSSGCMYTKRAYWDIEQPDLKMSLDKSELHNDPQIQYTLAGDFHRDKNTLMILLPLYERILDKSDSYFTKKIAPFIKSEIAKLKQAINYEDMVREHAEEVQLFQKDPALVDKKYNIRRDKFGQEISRDGVPNPYYTKTKRKHLVSIDNFHESLVSPAEQAKILWKCEKRAIREDTARAKQIQINMAKIKASPTANVWEI